MGLSSIAVQQREKEAKSLNSFLAFSLVGSLALHIGLLASGIGNLLSRTPDLKEEPLEVVMVDTPKVEVEKSKVEPQPRQIQPQQVQSRLVQPQREPQVVRQPSSPPKVEARTLPQQPAPRVAPTPVVVAPKQPVESLKPASAPAVPNQQLRSALRSGGGGGGGSANVLTGVGDPTAPAVGIGGGGVGGGTGSGSGSGTGTGSGSGSGSTVATGPRTVRQGSGDGGVACRKCSKPKYPQEARRRGVEGAAKVKLEVDEKGNVTDAKIAESSGNAALDEAAVSAARKWKLENSKGSSQGIVAKVDFALEGSERARRAEERKKRREARRKRRQAETATENKAPVATNSSPRRNEAAAPKPQQPQSPKPPQQPASSNQNRLREALRRP